jgi:acyl-CoA reductase-like NAD-dependent aldehyde dehydrogenase
MMERLEVLKTYKLYIGGAFPRTESGRFYPVHDSKKRIIANMCLSSRKDFRNAVVAARGVANAWAGRTGLNRSQILYRIAEMLEGRKAQFISELIQLGATKVAAEKEVNQSIDLWIYYAGWCDKYTTLFSSVNPVASSHFNFSVPEATGVVSLIATEDSALYGLSAAIAPIIAGGNVCVVLASEMKATCAISFAEVLQTSDLPSSVVNILTGNEKELVAHFSNHMDVNAIVYCRNNKVNEKLIAENCALNVKRYIKRNSHWKGEANDHSPYHILDLQEIKTTWHPIENIGIGGAKY